MDVNRLWVLYMKKKGIVTGILAVLFLVLPYMAAPLASMIDPVNGVMGASLSAGTPSAEISDPRVPGKAWVVWDEFGVPHIYATTDEAGIYAVGWVTASQRLFQMDLLRRVPEGRLAALVGEKGVESDVFMIQSGIAESVNKSWELIKNTPELAPVKEMLEYYAMGVNSYIEYAVKHNQLPLEYRVLGLTPEPWEPRDTIAVAKLIAYGLAWNNEDLVMQKLVNRLGENGIYLAEIFDFLNWTDTYPQAQCEYAVYWANVTGLNNTLTLKQASVPSVINVDNVLELTESTARLLGWTPPVDASNNWVVNGSYTVSGLPILANDPHLELTAPPIWLLLEINTPSFKSIGNLFPGTPLVVIGRNTHLAWAFTNVMGDFTDYYYYVWNGDQYLYKGEWLTPTKETVEIKVWDPFKRTYSTQTVTVMKTVHGYVIDADGEKLAVRWTGQDASAEIAFFYFLNKATTVKEALQAQKYFHVPVQNFVVADDQGNFAYSPFGAYPVRTNLPVYNISGKLIVNKGWLPFNGSAGEGEWAGYLSPGQIPILYDPPVPFIATANSKPWNGTCGDFIGWHYHDKYREERIHEMLNQLIAEKGKLTPTDIAKVQTDITDLGVKDYLHELLSLTCSSDLEVRSQLLEWYKNTTLMDPDAWQPSVAAAWIITFHHNLWKTIYGEDSDISFFRAYYALHFIKAYKSGDPVARSLLGDKTLMDLAEESLNEALEFLEQYYGTSDYTAWRYGDLHYYDVHHAAFNVLDLDKLPAGGFTWTINVAPSLSYSLENGMPVRHGPSLRQIVDLSTDEYWIAIPGGDSGNPFSPFYQNIYKEYWVKGEYIVYKLGQPAEAYGAPSLVINGSG